MILKQDVIIESCSITVAFLNNCGFFIYLVGHIRVCGGKD